MGAPFWNLVTQGDDAGGGYGGLWPTSQQWSWRRCAWTQIGQLAVGSRDPTNSRTIPWIVGMFREESFSGKGKPGGTGRPLEDEQATPERQLLARAE